MTAFKLPDLGEGLSEADIVAWHVAAGEHVVVDQPLLSVETDKAVVEIPSPKSGHVARLLVQPGEHVRVGAALLEFEDGPHAESETVVGTLAAAPVATSTPTPAPPVAPAKGRAAPAVRVRARELGVDLADVAPSGPGNTVTVADVENAAAAPASDAEALRGARRAMAANMAQAGREVVPATLLDDADIEQWSSGDDITIRLIRAIIAGCGAEPALNATFDAARLLRRRNPQIDLGLAVDSPAGLFVPVLRDVARLDADGWRQQVEAAKKAVQDRSLAAEALRHPTITLSNFGSIGGQHAALVVMPPQVAIVGVGRARTIAVRSQAGLVAHRALPLSLTFDHRAITGGEAARFLRAVIADLEQAN